MWWSEVQGLRHRLGTLDAIVDSRARVAPSATLIGAVSIGVGSVVCPGAYIEGPVQIGENCVIGNNTLIRGATLIGSSVRVGFGTEIKNAIIGEEVSVGPQCFIADSKVEHGAYLGALVRTSNHRLDRRTVRVLRDGELIDTGMEKLGCLIGAGANLGVQTIILPGRTIAAGSLYSPGITIDRNLPKGRYRLVQAIETF